MGTTTKAAFEAAAKELGVPLKVVSDTLAGGREAYRARLILVRPDQYVAAVLPLTATDELAAFFAQSLLPAR